MRGELPGRTSGRRAAPLATRAMVAALLIAGLFAPPAGVAGAQPAPGAPAPAFAVTGPGGEPFELAALRGKVVLLHFWATWCDGCRVEMPALGQLLGELHARGLEVLAVSVDEPRERRAAVALAATHRVPLAFLAAARANGFGPPPVLPMTYVIDRDGVLRSRLLPTRAPLDLAALRAAVAPWLDAPGRDAPGPQASE